MTVSHPRDDLPGNIKVTREDWLSLARDVLVNRGVGELKILALAGTLGVSRSSFYWYFQNRADLLDALLNEWEARNTQTIVANCALPASGINAAVCNFFLCFVDPLLFDPGLDFAVREWARRDPSVRDRIDAADALRLDAITGMFTTHGYPETEADSRARILYFMQLGYHALDQREELETRMSRVPGFLTGFTGQQPDAATVQWFAHKARKVAARRP